MGKYDKFICTELKKKHMLPGPSPEERDQLKAEGLRISMEHVLWIDDEIIPGAYYGESTWIWPSSYPNQITREEQLKRTANQKPMFPHVHDFPELLSWWGADPDHPEDTNGMAMLMGDVEIPLDKSWIVYIPAGLKHMPLRPRGAKETAKPLVHWTFGPGEYTREKENSHKDSGEQKNLNDQTLAKLTKEDIEKFFVYGYNEKFAGSSYIRNIDFKYLRPFANVNENIIPGSELGCEAYWLMPGEKSKSGRLLMDAHTLPYGTSIVINSMNYKDITDLCAEVELWVGGEKHIITKSFGAYIPPNVEQGPMIIRDIKQQTFFMTAYPVGKGIEKYRGR